VTRIVSTPTEDRRLLAEVSRWRKANGWSDSSRGWINEQSVEDAAVAVKANSDAANVLTVTLRKGNGGWHHPDHYVVVDVQQAVDFLVALGILPARFSSAYEADAVDAEKHAALLAAVEQVIAAGQLDWDGVTDVEAIQGRAHTALIEAYQAATR